MGGGIESSNGVALWGGDVHLACFYGDALVSAILILRVAAWKNAMGAINKCVAFIDGAHG